MGDKSVKETKRQAGAELGQAQLKLGLAFFNQFASKRPLAANLLFSGPNNHLIAIINITLSISS